MTAAAGLPTLRLIRQSIDLMDGLPPLQLTGLAPGQWRFVNAVEQARLDQLLRRTAADQSDRSRADRSRSGRGGRAGGGKSGRAGGGG
jgi:23S rRNA pseudouridine2457 synthase